MEKTEQEMVELASHCVWEAYEAFMEYEDKHWETDPDSCGKICESVMKAIGRKSLDMAVEIADEFKDHRPVTKRRALAIINAIISVRSCGMGLH